DQLKMSPCDAVDGAHSAASECHRVVALTQSGHRLIYINGRQCGLLTLRTTPASSPCSGCMKDQAMVDRRKFLLGSTALVAASAVVTGRPDASKAQAPLPEYKPGQAFSGVIGRTFDVSKPAWPAPVRAREGTPNVLFIVLDDTGFAHIGCFGSPINTPNLDALAADGLRYNNMHTTALCSPSRSCILTGRNHHSNGMACITEGSEGFPGSNGQIPFENGFLSDMLLQKGYNTYCLGKWHLA